jgi:hypothetical protein
VIVKQGKCVVIDVIDNGMFLFSAAYKPGDREITIIPPLFIDDLPVIVPQEPCAIKFPA